jgi:hypothetical protein
MFMSVTTFVKLRVVQKVETLVTSYGTIAQKVIAAFRITQYVL